MDRGVHHSIHHLQKFLLCPELHLGCFFFAHASGLCGRVALQTVVADSMVENGTHLIVDGFEIGGGKGSALLIGYFSHFILPAKNILWCNLR